MAKRHTAAAAACLLLAGCLVWAGRKRTVTYLPDESAFPNAQIGYAPGVLDSGTEGATLRYLGLTWRQLEPEEGAYAWEAIEQTCHLAELRAQGVHLVLRISCDEPGDEAHLDIPDWLYEQTGTGRWYDIAYGKGYAPDYTDPVFFAAHERLLRAVGERLGADGFVSYVELGSLGHWGEWHVKSGEGLPSMPDEAVRDRYAALYREAFPQAALLMRRPFRFAAEHGLGLYNDMTGLPEDTEEWLGWIACGGWYEGDPEGLVPMPDAWQTAPIGGELTSRLSMEQLLTTDLSQTVSLIRQSHMSFLGPKTAETAFREGYDAVLAALGYRLRVTEASLRRVTGGTVLTLTFTNDGTAPFYWDWPVNVYVEEADGTTVEAQPLALSLPDLLPGGCQTVKTKLAGVPGCWWEEQDRRITLGIVDPMTGRDAVRFAMQTAQEDGRTVLFAGE